jgi:hypothetical protein
VLALQDSQVAPTLVKIAPQGIQVATPIVHRDSKVVSQLVYQERLVVLLASHVEQDSQVAPPFAFQDSQVAMIKITVEILMPSPYPQAASKFVNMMSIRIPSAISQIKNAKKNGSINVLLGQR